MEPAIPVDEIDQSAVVETHVVALDPLLPRRHGRDEIPHFLRVMRVRDADDTQPLGEPRNRKLDAFEILFENEVYNTGNCVRTV